MKGSTVVKDWLVLTGERARPASVACNDRGQTAELDKEIGQRELTVSAQASRLPSLQAIG
jgi:hypothetical protein